MDFKDIVRRPEFIMSIVAIIGVFIVAVRLTRPNRRAGASSSAPPGAGYPTGAPPPPPAPVATQVARPVEASHPSVTFADVAGLDEAKAEMREIAEYLSAPKRYQALGAKLPRGVLLHGLPGCGKTLLARALAGETGVPFYFASAAGFVEQFVGLGAARVRQLFEDAKKTAPCIVFIDELDAIGRKRDADVAGGREFDHTLNQLLVELDGFQGSSGVLVLGATNRPELIDAALLRPGRFDRRIQVEQPDRHGREQILRLHASRRPFSNRVDWAEVALHTAGLTAAELANLVNEASLLAARRHRSRIPPEDVEEAASRVLSGMLTSRLMGEEEKTLVAVHEAGHSLLSLLVKGMKPPARVSIMRRTGALGRSVWSGGDDKEVLTKRELMAQLIVLLGGRAAELNTFGEPSTRAEDDLDNAAALARRMVERWAMTGRFDLAGGGDETAKARWTPGSEEVGQLLARSEHAARVILRDNRARLQAIAAALAEHETLTAAQLETITGLGEQGRGLATLSPIRRDPFSEARAG